MRSSPVSFTDEFTTPIPPPRLFKALILDADNLIPKLAPQAIKNVEIIQGNGGPGTIKKINFPQGSPFEFVKHKVDAVDEENMSYTYTVIEGDALADKLEKITYEMKLEAGPDGGTKGKNVSTYYVKPGVEIKEEEIKGGKEKAEGVFKAVEGYLLANPEAYA